MTAATSRLFGPEVTFPLRGVGVAVFLVFTVLIGWMARQSVRPRVLVSGSAIGYYGPRGDEALDESAAPGNDFAAHLCRDWETEAMQAEGLDVRTCRVRTGIVLARQGDYSLREFNILISYCAHS